MFSFGGETYTRCTDICSVLNHFIVERSYLNSCISFRGQKTFTFIGNVIPFPFEEMNNCASVVPLVSFELAKSFNQKCEKSYYEKSFHTKRKFAWIWKKPFRFSISILEFSELTCWEWAASATTRLQLKARDVPVFISHLFQGQSRGASIFLDPWVLRIEGIEIDLAPVLLYARYCS